MYRKRHESHLTVVKTWLSNRNNLTSRYSPRYYNRKPRRRGISHCSLWKHGSYVHLWYFLYQEVQQRWRSYRGELNSEKKKKFSRQILNWEHITRIIQMWEYKQILLRIFSQYEMNFVTWYKFQNHLLIHKIRRLLFGLLRNEVW